MKEFIEQSDSRTKLLAGGLALSLLLNVGLGIGNLRSDGVSDDYDGDAATDATFYEEQANQLASRNEALEAQLAELQQAASEVEETPDTPAGDALDSATEQTDDLGTTAERDATRSEVREATLGFLDGLLNVDTSEMNDDDRRAKIAPYVTNEIGSRIAPTAEELVEMGLIGDAGEEEEEDIPENMYTYSQELTGLQLFFDEASLSGSTIHVIAMADSDVEDSYGTDYTLNERYHIELERADGNWVVSNYTLETIN